LKYNPKGYKIKVEMIKSFKCSETEKVWEGVFSKRLPHDIQRSALMRLGLLNAAKHVEDLRLPAGNKLEPLRGNRAGQYSIRINQKWRICFKWHDGNAHDVEIVDYH